MKKRNYLIAAAVLAAYALLLVLLVHVESADPESPISSFPLAIWYSLVTMTTVGYGDLYPVTAAGRIVGVLFLLLSAGALTALISFGITWINGTGLPRMRLHRYTGRQLYIFDSMDSASQTLADNILRDDPKAVCIFSGTDSRAEDRCLHVPMSTREVVDALKASENNPTVLFTGRDAEERLNRLHLPENVPLVCQTPHIPEALQDGRRFFDRNMLCAAMYWQNYPLPLQDQTVLLVGFGSLGRQILEYALESCIFSPIRRVEYHVFGPGAAFMADHPLLAQSVGMNTRSDTQDSLFFHEGSWNSDPELLMRADRIVFCDDCEEVNSACYRRLRTYFPVNCEIHLYSTGCTSPDIPAFGMDSEIFTPELVLRSGLERMGREIHEIYRSGSGGSAPAWEVLSSFLRRSNFASAQHMREKVRFLLQDSSQTEFSPEQLLQAYERFLQLQKQQPDLCRRIEHDRWVRFHAMYNWHYAPVRCNALREHPMMVPFDELSEAEQAKDDYAWELIGKLAVQV